MGSGTCSPDPLGSCSSPSLTLLPWLFPCWSVSLLLWDSQEPHLLRVATRDWQPPARGPATLAAQGSAEEGVGLQCGDRDRSMWYSHHAPPRWFCGLREITRTLSPSQAPGCCPCWRRRGRNTQFTFNQKSGAPRGPHGKGFRLSCFTTCGLHPLKTATGHKEMAYFWNVEFRGLVQSVLSI